MARPPALTTDVLKKLSDAIRVGATNEIACKYAGISESVFYEMKAGKFPRGIDKNLKAEFSEVLTRAEGEGAVQLLAVIQKAGREGDWRAALAILERRYADSYGKQVHEHTGPNGAPLTIQIQRITREVDA